MSKNKNKAKKSRRRARPKTAAVAGVSVHGTQPATAPSVARSNDLRSRISFGPAEHEEASSSVGDNSEDGTDSGDDSRPAFENTKSEHAKPKDLKSRASFGPASHPTTNVQADQMKDVHQKSTTVAKTLTTFEGLRGLGELPAPVVEFLQDGRFTPSAQDADYSLREKHSLVVLFQALAAFEECLSLVKSSEKAFALSKLQSALGIFVSSSWDATVVVAINKAYVDARTREIVACLEGGNIPGRAEDDLLALLISLIDRRIVFGFRRRFAKPLGEDTVTTFSRCTERCDAVSTALSTMSPSIWHEFGAMMPEGLRSVDLGNPWDDAAWLAENLGAEFKLPLNTEEDADVEEQGHAAILEALDGTRSSYSVTEDSEQEEFVETRRALNKRKRTDLESDGESDEKTGAAKRQKV